MMGVKLPRSPMAVWQLAAVGIIFLLLAGQAWAQLYAAPGAGRGALDDTNLYILNSDGTVRQTIGETGHNITGMDFHPLTGQLFATTTPNDQFPNPSSLIRINPETGAVTPIGAHGGIGPVIVDITFAPDGTLYGWNNASGGKAQLVTLNLDTGVSTGIGTVANNGVELANIGGSALDMALDGTLYLSGNTGVGSVGICDVIDVDTVTGTFTKITDLVDDHESTCWAYNASTHDDAGQLWATQTKWASPRVLVTIDVASGQVTERGATVDNLSALAWRAPQETLYGISLNGFSEDNPGPSSLYRIDPVTGAGTLVGTNLGYAVNSIAIDPTTRFMYATTVAWPHSSAGKLLLINPETGTAEEVGDFELSFCCRGLAFNSLGELWGWTFTPVTIDKSNATAVEIDSAVSFSGGVSSFDNGDRLLVFVAMDVYEINQETGVPVLETTLGFDPGRSGADINNSTGLLWAPSTSGRTSDSWIRVTDYVGDSYNDIDTDVTYLIALTFGEAVNPFTNMLFQDGFEDKTGPE